MNAFHSHLLAMAAGIGISLGIVTAIRNEKVMRAEEAESRVAGLGGAPSIVEGGAVPSVRKARAHGDLGSPVDAGQLTFLSNGNIVVPAKLAKRIVVGAMDTEGYVNAEELSLIGLDEESAKRLQGVLDGLKELELERQATHAEIVRQNHDETVIRIPGTKRDDLRKQKYEREIDQIFGRSRPFVERSLSHVATLTNLWGEAELVVTARPTGEGYTEYKLFGYDPARPPLLDEGQDPSVEAIRVWSFRSKEVPERLRHLFD